MPKKRLNIILILLVLGLWGTVAYKSLNRFFPPENRINESNNGSQSFNIKRIEKENFSLEKLPRDPFLSKVLEVKSSPVVIKSIVPRAKVINTPKPLMNKPLMVWPKVYYYGYIKSQQKTEELILVKIDNKLLKVRKNQDIEGLVIKRVFKDSIEVMLNKSKKFIYLE
ncbi:hypothetical protein EQG63_04800 [Flavobacterium amnicola]|uniref:Type II secretion system protein GspC N-terminal domain-containing protein n=1 Tax=Flavobacterium amnicola TaxID=2506422 RepID=A0A4V1N2C7_9FLAO|nr:hypothetical protein [Flavobacterium amnicola]RXR21261.1 hypothetical protein EQG63_04800 [Flavobacterium amnicola]